jgi:hypothetical protein
MNPATRARYEHDTELARGVLAEVHDAGQDHPGGGLLPP